MFANTLTLSVGGSSHTLVRVNQDNYGSEYRERDSTSLFILKIRHSVRKAQAAGQADLNQHNVSLVYTQYATPTTTQKTITSSFTFSESQDMDPSVSKDVTKGVMDMALASSAALLTGLVNGEN